VQVYKGEATVVLADGKPMIVRKGHEALLGNEITARKFDENNTDDLYNWSSRRSGYLAMANVSAARSMGNSYSGGGWTFNPWLDMFTMVPGNGMLWSPFGFGFFSPFNAYAFGYYPYGGYGYGYGYPYGYGYYGGTGTTYGGRPVSQTGSGSTGGTSVSSGRLGGASGGFTGSGSTVSSGGGRSFGGGGASGGGGRGGH
jgi:hypothetical protein